MAVNAKIFLSFWFLNFLYLATGIVLIVLSVIWLSNMQADIILVLTPDILKSGLSVGAIIAGSWLIGSVGSSFHVKRQAALYIFSYLVILVIIFEILIGGTLWFNSLTSKHRFASYWYDDSVWGPSQKAKFQDEFQCCGFANNTDFRVSSTLCPDNPAHRAPQGCGAKLPSVANGKLITLYTATFAFVITDCIILLSSIILIQARGDEARFIRIRQKQDYGATAYRS